MPFTGRIAFAESKRNHAQYNNEKQAYQDAGFQSLLLGIREGKYLFYIEEALDRVRNGSFGVCKKCGKRIPKPRLEAVPTAKMCIDCKTKQERAAEAASVG